MQTMNSNLTYCLSRGWSLISPRMFCWWISIKVMKAGMIIPAKTSWTVSSIIPDRNFSSSVSLSISSIYEIGFQIWKISGKYFSKMWTSMNYLLCLTVDQSCTWIMISLGMRPRNPWSGKYVNSISGILKILDFS